MIDSDGFRANVGIILCNLDRRLFWGRRIGQDAWQFPQGGIQNQETPEQAMYRELEEEVAAGPAAQTYADSDFVEADTNRDPFRAYTNLFVPHTVEPGRIQREVIMGQTAVDEMHLIAIVSGVANPSAMLVGTDGTGHTVHRGDFVGRAEIVQTGGEDSVPVTLNWRVERIRDDAVILSREDPTAPNRPPLTREIALHDPSEVEAPG